MNAPLSRTFWWLWTGALLSALATFVFPFLALYLASLGMPAQRIGRLRLAAHRPRVGGGQRVARADGADGIDARRKRLHQPFAECADRAAAAEREHYRFRSHGQHAGGGRGLTNEQETRTEEND